MKCMDCGCILLVFKPMFPALTRAVRFYIVLIHSMAAVLKLFVLTSPYTHKEKYEDLQKPFLVWVLSTDTYCIRN